MLACGWGFDRIPGLVACGDTAGLSPVIAFELARTPAEVAALFGAEPCRSALVAAQRAGLWLDAFGFIPAYTAFLCCAAWATTGRARRWIVAGLLVAGLSDEIEGMLLFAILRTLPGTSALLGALFWAVHLKFLLLALGTAAIAAPLLATWRHVAMGLGVVIGVMAAFVLIDFFELPATASRMMTAFTFAWGCLLAAAAIGSVWPRLLAARRPAPARPSA